jgi:hypothetical protein
MGFTVAKAMPPLSSRSSSDRVMSGVRLDPGPIGVQPASDSMTELTSREPWALAKAGNRGVRPASSQAAEGVTRQPKLPVAGDREFESAFPQR